VGDTLIVWKLDRLGRNLHHLVSTVHDLMERLAGFRVLLECTEPDSSRANQGFILYGDDRDFRYMKTEKGLGKSVKSILKILPQTKYGKMAP
jgi:hypothetical protein